MPSLADAKAEAKRLLPGIVREMLPDGDAGTFSVTVRDETGQTVFQTTLTLTCTGLVQDWPEPPAVTVLESIPARASMLLREHGMVGALEHAEERMRELRLKGDLGGALLWARIAISVLDVAHGEG